jgi:hypothetical protein
MDLFPRDGLEAAGLVRFPPPLPWLVMGLDVAGREEVEAGADRLGGATDAPPREVLEEGTLCPAGAAAPTDRAVPMLGARVLDREPPLVLLAGTGELAVVPGAENPLRDWRDGTGPADPVAPARLRRP